MKPRMVALHLALALVYALVFAKCYEVFLYRHYEYVGYALYSRDVVFLSFSFLAAVVPVVFFRGPKAVSSVVSVFVYLLLYVPIIVTFTFGSALPPGQIALIQATFMACMSLLFLSDLFVVRNPVSLESGLDLMPVVLGLAVLSTVYMMVIYRGNLTFPSFGQALYDERSAKDYLGAGLATRYISSWLATVFIPICFAYGLAARRPVYFITAVLACLVMYMAAANKLVIILPFAYVAFYFMVRHRLQSVYLVLTGALSAGIGALLVTAQPGSPWWTVTSIALNRTLGSGGQITMAYRDFFAVHPRTDYSHVMGIKLLTGPYPYGDLMIGQVVGQHFWTPLMNANANFWATDGFAALGLLGVPVVSVVCALWFAAMNTATRAYDTLFVVLCFIPFVTVLLNQSMFSSIWSGGAFLMLVFFLFNKRNATLTRRAELGALA